MTNDLDLIIKNGRIIDGTNSLANAYQVEPDVVPDPD
jgi:hypothetical protein